MTTPDRTKMIEDTLFTCPACGAHTWGTTFESGTTLAHATGNCHGYLAAGQPCSFSWPRVEDAKVMKGTGKFTTPRSVTGRAGR